MPGCCLDVVSKHASVRSYAGGVEERDLEAIVEAARRAPSDWGLQPLSITVVRDEGLKRAIAEAVGGQEHVARAPVLLVFSVDYAKHREAAGRLGVGFAEPGLGHLTAALIDVGIAAGWAALAAESLGYGVVFIAVYANPCRVAEILGLPPLTLPVLGMCVGRPAEKPMPRPRHPLEAFTARDRGVDPKRAGEALAALYGERGAKLYRTVLAPGGFNDSVSKTLADCARRRGFRLA